MNDTNQRISVSASFNRASNVAAAGENRIREDWQRYSSEGGKLTYADYVIQFIDQLARAIFFKEEKFLEELAERNKPTPSPTKKVEPKFNGIKEKHTVESEVSVDDLHKGDDEATDQ